MRVVLIDPKGNQTGLNAGLAYLAASLKKDGHEVKIIDFNHYFFQEDERLEQVKNAPLVGITFKSFTIGEGVRLAGKVRLINPQATLICGGPHITIDGEKFMEDNPVFDIAILGEGENSLCDIANGANVKEMKGVVIRRQNGTIFKTEGRSSLPDLDKLPFPDYTCFDSLNTYGVKFLYNYYPFISSRGCPCHCVYCSVPLISRGKWRGRTPENMIEELKDMKKKYKLKEFAIIDDNFTVDIHRAKKFCELLIEEKLDLKWQCPNGIRAASTDPELVQLMKKSGLFLVNFGVENAVPEIFETIGKGGTLKDIKNAIQWFKKEKIKVGGFFIIGLPASSKELDRKSIKLSQKLGLDYIHWNNLVPYPGTKLFDLIQTDKRFTMVGEWRDGLSCGPDIKPVFETKEYSAQERKDMFFYANIKTRYYGNLLSMNFSNIQKAKTLISAILKYDPWNIFKHLCYIMKGLMIGIKNKTVRVSW